MIADRRQPGDEFHAEEPMRLKGKDVEFQDEGPGTIADENEDSIYIISKFFTGWMFKTEYFDLLGVED